MSGPKYYTVRVSNGEDVNEVLHRLSNMQNGVRVTVSGNQLNYTVSNDAWMQGVNQQYLEQQVRAAEAQIANDRRMREMLRKGKEDESQWVEESIRRINGQFESAKETMGDAISKAQERVRSVVSKMETPLGRVSVSDKKRELIAKLDRISKEYKTLDEQYNTLVSELNNYRTRIKGCSTLDEFNSAKKKRPKNKFNGTIDRSPIDAITETATSIEEKLKTVAERLTALDDGLRKASLDSYRERVMAHLEKIDVLDDDAPAKIDKIFEDIIKENEARLANVRRREESAASRSEIERINQELDALREVLRITREGFNVNARQDVDATGDNQRKMDACRSLIEEIESLKHMDTKQSDRLENAIRKMDSIRVRIRTPGATKDLSDLESELKDLLEASNEYSRRYSEFEAAKETYKEAYSNFITVFGSDNEVFEKMGHYDELADSVFSAENAETVIEDLNECSSQLDEAVLAVKKEGTFNLLCNSFRNSKNSKVLMRKAGNGEKHCYYMKTKEEYRGVIFDISKTDEVAVLPRMVILSNGKTLIEPDKLQSLYDTCGWSEEMEEETESYRLGVERTEAPSEVRQSMSRTENMVRLTERQSIRYLKAMGYSADEMADLGYIVKESDEEEDEEDVVDVVQTEEENARYADR